MDDDSIRLLTINSILGGSSPDDAFCGDCASVVLLVSKSCPHCTVLKPVIKQLQLKYNSDVDGHRDHVFVHYSDESPAAFRLFGVSTVPMIVVRNSITGGWHKFTGARTFAGISSALSCHGASSVACSTALQTIELRMPVDGGRRSDAGRAQTLSTRGRVVDA
jgi:glutaredoxin